MKQWPTMFSKALSRLTFACSLALLSALALASPLSDYRDAVKGAASLAEFRKVVNRAPSEVTDDATLRAYCAYSVDELTGMLDRDPSERGKAHNWRDVRDSFVAAIDSRIAVEAVPEKGQVKNAQKSASEILSSPIYRDRREREGRNWLDKAGDRIGQRVIEFLSGLIPKNGPNFNFGGPAAVPGLIILAWVLIAAALAVVLYLILRNVRLAGRRKRVGGILGED